MPTEAEVEAAAEVMAGLPTIDSPRGLSAPQWMGSARAMLDAAERVRAPADDLREAFRAGFWVYCGPANLAEYKALERDEQEAWEKWAKDR